MRQTISGPFRRLLRNFGSLTLALLLAIAIWIVAKLESDPFSTREYPGVPLTVESQPENTVLFESLAERVAVTVRAPESVLAEVRGSDFVASVDLSTVPPGTPTLVPVQVASINDDVRILDWDPAEQIVLLEAMDTITMPVTIQVDGQVATGYQATHLTVNPDQVSIYGPEPLLGDVASVSGSVDISGAKADVVRDVRTRPLDAEGNLVPGLQWSPDTVEVRVAVERRLGFKPDVEVVPDLQGEPADGYRLGSVGVDPSTVTLAGVPSVLEELPGFVETWPISVTGATEDLIELSALNVPNNVVVVGVDYVTVTVEVLPIQSSRAMTSTVEVEGVRPGWMAFPSPDVVDVILEGPDAVLGAMTPNDLRVVVDVFGLGLGVHRVEPDVEAPDQVTVVSIIPETIEVVIAVVPIPTPALTVTPTLTVTLTVQP